MNTTYLESFIDAGFKLIGRSFSSFYFSFKGKQIRISDHRNTSVFHFSPDYNILYNEITVEELVKKIEKDLDLDRMYREFCIAENIKHDEEFEKYVKSVDYIRDIVQEFIEPKRALEGNPLRTFIEGFSKEDCLKNKTFTWRGCLFGTKLTSAKSMRKSKKQVVFIKYV